MPGLVETIELALAKSSLDGNRNAADKFAQVCESIYAGHTVWAVILADAYGFPAGFVKKMRKLFGVGRIG